MDDEFKFPDTIKPPDVRKPLDLFLSEVNNLIQSCIDQELPVPLPPLEMSIQAVEAISAALLNCKICDALCCKKSMSAISGGRTDHMGMIDQEIKIIRERLSYREWVEFKKKLVEKDIEIQGQIVHGWILPFPCFFLESNNLCSIYSCRPIVCRMFPFNFYKYSIGNEKMDGFSVNCDCPQAINLIKEVYKGYHQEVSKLIQKKASG
ncbi:MAG: YkgJ family cysteine cluster protein [Dehalococcoidia bacterium]